MALAVIMLLTREEYNVHSCRLQLELNTLLNTIFFAFTIILCPETSTFKLVFKP